MSKEIDFINQINYLYDLKIINKSIYVFLIKIAKYKFKYYELINLTKILSYIYKKCPLETIKLLDTYHYIIFNKNIFYLNDKKIINDMSIYNNITYTKSQSKAIKNIIDFLMGDQNIFGLFGYAGTGKTALLTNIVGYLINLNYLENVAFTAPTNKAVSVLKSMYKSLNNNKENITIDFITVQRLLSLTGRLDNNGDLYFVQYQDDINDYDLIIIDECSMINKNIIFKIFESLLKKKNKGKITKIIFVGDPAQLPPVNEKDSIVFKLFDNIDNILDIVKQNIKKDYLDSHDLTNIIYKKYSILKEIVRNKNNDVHALSMDIRKWIECDIDYINIKKYKGDNLIIYHNNHDSWLNKYISYHNNINIDDNIIILTWTNEKKDYYNTIIRNKIFNKVKISRFEVGDILIFNDYYNYYANKFYTSELVHVLKVNIQKKYKLKNIFFDSEKIAKKIIDKKLVEDAIIMINYINKIIKELYLSVYNLYVTKNNQKDIVYLVTIINDPKINDIKKYVDECINNLKKNIQNDQDMELIRHLWQLSMQCFIDPFANVSYGYCITVHKSQGSGFTYTFIDLKNICLNHKQDESKRCIYTSITRSTKELHILF